MVVSDAIGELGLKIVYDVQQENACLALAVLQHLGVAGAGMRDFYWPCRMERFRLGEGLDVVLDGCHNGDSVHQFVRDLARKFHDKRIVILFGAGLEKCLDTMLQELLSAPRSSRGMLPSLLMLQSRHFKSLSEHELLMRIPPAERASRVVGLSDEELADSSALVRQAGGTVGPRLQWAIDHYGLSPSSPTSSSNRRYVQFVVVVFVCCICYADAVVHLVSTRRVL